MDYDVAIIGGGVVGCATLFELTNHGYRCVLLEKNEALVSEASCGNSGMLHTGFDAVGLELDCIRACQSRVFGVLEKLGVPVNHVGATMVVWNEEQRSAIPGILARSRASGVQGTQELSASQLYQRESSLRPGALCGVSIPGEAVTDPWMLPVLLANNARQKGAQSLLNERVVSCTHVGQCPDVETTRGRVRARGVVNCTGLYGDLSLLNAQVVSCTRVGQWTDVETTRGRVRARGVVNCAGLYGDVVDTLAAQHNFRIKPRKGQYTMYSRTARRLVNSSILPVPTKVGKGVIVFRSVYDNIVVGPTAENVESRRRADIDDAISKRLLTVTRETVKGLDKHDVVGLYTGVRPATEGKDYIITANEARSWVTAGGIRSTGLSGCLGIADKVRHLVEDTLAVEPSWGRNSSLARPEVRFTKFGTTVIDGTEYRVTHPITLAGKQDVLAKM